MTTFKERPLCSLAFVSEAYSYDDNLAALLSLIEKTPRNAVVVIPEVAVTNFDYGHFDRAAAYAETITEALLAASGERIIAYTVIEERAEGKICNVAKVLHRGRLIHEQAKTRLFAFGGEDKFFTAGDSEEVTIFEADGVKFGLLICFELRFKALWQRLEGADIILIPAQWGKLRTQNFVTLTNALAVINQCYVVASDTNNSDTTGMSGIITPFGEERRNDGLPCLEIMFSEKEVRKMRRYLDVGIT